MPLLASQLVRSGPNDPLYVPIGGAVNLSGNNVDIAGDLKVGGNLTVSGQTALNDGVAITTVGSQAALAIVCDPSNHVAFGTNVSATAIDFGVGGSSVLSLYPTAIIGFKNTDILGQVTVHEAAPFANAVSSGNLMWNTVNAGAGATEIVNGRGLGAGGFAVYDGNDGDDILDLSLCFQTGALSTFVPNTLVLNKPIKAFSAVSPFYNFSLVSTDATVYPASWTALTTEWVDTPTPQAFDYSDQIAGGIFTTPVKGIYTFTIVWRAQDGGSVSGFRLLVNSVFPTQDYFNVEATGGAVQSSGSATWSLQLDAGIPVQAEIFGGQNTYVNWIGQLNCQVV